MGNCYNYYVADFQIWIKSKYADWSNGGKKSETQFAEWLGINQATLNAWMRGSRGEPKSKKIIDALAKRYSEVYEILGIPSPEGDDGLSGLPPDLADAIREARSDLVKRGILEMDEESKRIIQSAFAKRGLQITFTETED